MNDRVQRLKKLARLLDSQFEGPFGIRFGLDPLIGLIPGFGDILTSLISFFIVIEAYNLGSSPSLLMRMIFNILIEDFIKVVPLLGQFFDFYWKSNLKNIDLIERHIQSPERTKKTSVLFLALLGIAFILAMTLVLSLLALIFVRLFNFLFN